MPLATVLTRASRGIDAPLVTVEVQITGGLFATSIVGLTETAVKESGFRVRAALRQSGFTLPQGHVIVHLAPAGLRKSGGRYDLAIALGVLAASSQIAADALDGQEFIGELGLDGSLRPVPGILPAALATRAHNRRLVVPAANAPEAALAEGLPVCGARTLLDVCGALAGHSPLPAARPPACAAAGTGGADLADVRGQPQGRRALEVAAAGGHGLLLIGPPGSGKSMLAQRLPGILPPMTDDEALETAVVASVGPRGFDAARDWGRRPFREPHHTASYAALVGGGSRPQPGEVSLAHHGVLFLDELPEFKRGALEALREPLESGRILLARAQQQVEYPARFQLVAAMNPCPCGHLGDSSGRCRCSADLIERYRSRVSGPLLDRIDMHVEMPRQPREVVMSEDATAEASAPVRERVTRAREVQCARQRVSNARLGQAATEALCRPEPAARALIEGAFDRLGLSARAYHRVLRLARTVADLAGSEAIEAAHMAEALGYRRLDRTTVS